MLALLTLSECARYAGECVTSSQVGLSVSFWLVSVCACLARVHVFARAHASARPECDMTLAAVCVHTAELQKQSMTQRIAWAGGPAGLAADQQRVPGQQQHGALPRPPGQAAQRYRRAHPVRLLPGPQRVLPGHLRAVRSASRSGSCQERKILAIKVFKRGHCTQQARVGLRRWYDQGEPKLCFVERKTHRESWKGEESVKERFMLPENKMVPYLEGEYTIDQAQADLRAKVRSSHCAASNRK